VLAGLLLLPVLELAVAIQVGRWVGALPTLAALVVIAFVGVALVRRQGAAAWRSLNQSLRAGELPSRELADAAVLVLAGALLIAPGFVTDVLALLLILPPTRPLARRPLERALRRAAADRVTLLETFPGQFGQGQFGQGRFAPGDVVEGEVIVGSEVVADDDPPAPRT
jgi:UPF0716 protein FxsA